MIDNAAGPGKSIRGSGRRWNADVITVRRYILIDGAFQYKNLFLFHVTCGPACTKSPLKQRSNLHRAQTPAAFFVLHL